MNEYYNWFSLSAAIIERACQDYISAYVRGSEKGMKECLDFFNSPWFDELCGTVDVNMDYFFKTLKIRGEYAKWRKERKCASRRCNCIHYKGGEWQNGTKEK